MIFAGLTGTENNVDQSHIHLRLSWCNLVYEGTLDLLAQKVTQGPAESGVK